MQLEEKTFTFIASLVNKARIALEAKDYISALKYYLKAEKEFPFPVESYLGSCFLYASIAEIYVLMDNNESAKIYFQKALSCIDGKDNAKILFELGMIYLNAGQVIEAKENFLRAYQINGKEMFLKETQHREFFEDQIFKNSTRRGESIII